MQCLPSLILDLPVILRTHLQTRGPPRGALRGCADVVAHVSQRGVDPGIVQLLVAARIRAHELEHTRDSRAAHLDLGVDEARAERCEDARVREDAALVWRAVGEVREDADRLEMSGGGQRRRAGMREGRGAYLAEDVFVLGLHGDCEEA